MRFADRIEAGKQLAQVLKGYKTENMMILALPRGGVPIGYELALELDVPLDVLIVRKLGTPGHEELAMGAIGPGGVVVMNHEVVNMMHISSSQIDQVLADEQTELRRRLRHFRGTRPFPDISGRTVVIVDDGLATGSTAMAAVQAVRAMKPAQVILAIPVCAKDSADRLRPMVDDLLCLQMPADFMAVGYWYNDFRQTTDAEVIDLLVRIWRKDADRTVKHT